MRRGASADEETQSKSGRPEEPAALLVGFDSAWTRKNRGAIAGVVRNCGGTYRELGLPRDADFNDASRVISKWQDVEKPGRTIAFLDQPTIVTNASGQRPVENLASSSVSRRYGGMQPASTSRAEMFGPEAGVWGFLKQFGGAADPLGSIATSQVFETYPALSLIALDWVLPDRRAAGRLPKYNPERKTFSIEDWRYVCERLSNELIARRCLMVGDAGTGYIVVPYGEGLRRELEERCRKIERDPSSCVRAFTLSAANQGA